MEVRYERCCGLDVHKKSISACCIYPEEVKLKKEIRSFGTLTDDLLALSDWLAERQITHVAMESTGSYWKPVWNILEASFELLLVNPQHIKAFNRDKTDTKDCEWLADLLRHGLLKASFVPDRRQRELRELTRYRTSLKQERTAEVNRLQKVLEGANIKLASVASDVMGKSSREMLAELLAGDKAPAEIAQLARGKLREKIPQLERALSGGFAPHQRFVVAQQLAHIDFLDESLAQISQEIEGRLVPLEAAVVARLDPIPGVATGVAQVIIAEIGPSVERFPSAGHIASWAGLCPGNRESAGKRRSGKTRKGNQALRTVLTNAAKAAILVKGSYLQAQYSRLLPRLGKNKATVAVARRILEIIYYLLNDPETLFKERGAHYRNEMDKQRAARYHARQLEALGYQVAAPPIAV
ncbi:MAG TPA: IS110 family transposase [Hyphomicrobiaceae bacterium]|jgi:transposase|nr:IS110 family transposase [Hyphomicrobiaceae bacterium]